MALNQEQSSATDEMTIAKNDIHKILNHIPIFVEEGKNIDQFLEGMKQSGVTGPLLEALEDYVRIIPIKLLQGMDLIPYHKTNIFEDSSDKKFQTIEKLKRQRIF